MDWRMGDSISAWKLEGKPIYIRDEESTKALEKIDALIESLNLTVEEKFLILDILNFKVFHTAKKDGNLPERKPMIR